VDEAAKKLDINDCEFAIMGEPELKDLEFKFFENMIVENVALFGGTLHQSKGMQKGGCSEFCIS
jgi:hypothetical protein